LGTSAFPCCRHEAGFFFCGIFSLPVLLARGRSSLAFSFLVRVARGRSLRAFCLVLLLHEGSSFGLQAMLVCSTRRGLLGLQPSHAVDTRRAFLLRWRLCTPGAIPSLHVWLTNHNRNIAPERVAACLLAAASLDIVSPRTCNLKMQRGFLRSPPPVLAASGAQRGKYQLFVIECGPTSGNGLACFISSDVHCLSTRCSPARVPPLWAWSPCRHQRGARRGGSLAAPRVAA
jgi:hypothetical protein